jgi:NAD(P)-dependent dehydrogenase (short-subunit alcohol dehydrogenase family)
LLKIVIVHTVTGAASGIGRSVADLLASHGALLSLADLNREPLENFATELRQKHYQIHDPATTDPILITVTDVRLPTSVNAWITGTTAHFQQPLAGAANMAGVTGAHTGAEAGSLRQLTDDEFNFVMDVNCKGVFNCMRAQLPAMREGISGRGGGAIVNASSIAGVTGVPYNAPYVASKHAVAGLTRTSAKEEGVRAIRVNAVAP